MGQLKEQWVDELNKDEWRQELKEKWVSTG